MKNTTCGYWAGLLPKHCLVLGVVESVYIHCDAYSQSHPHPHSNTLSQSHTLTLSVTHTHTHTHTHSQAFTNTETCYYTFPTSYTIPHGYCIHCLLYGMFSPLQVNCTRFLPPRDLRQNLDAW